MKDEAPIKESFFKRLFRSNKKRQEADSITQVVQQAPPADTLFSLSEIGRQVEQVKHRALSREKKLRVQELGLLQQDQAVMHKIRNVIAILEEKESDALVANTKLVELLGGTIRVESQPGKGSKFSVGIPFRKPDRMDTYHRP